MVEFKFILYRVQQTAIMNFTKNIRIKYILYYLTGYILVTVRPISELFFDLLVKV